MKQVIHSNLVLILFYIAYLIIILCIFTDYFLFILILHLIFIGIAFTSVGENIMRTLNHTKKILIKEDRDYLFPLFEEVYEQARADNPNLSAHIKLFINEEQLPNAFACASNTICVTKGAVQTFSREELQGVLAHEFGHISNGDTRITMIFCIGNVLFMIFAFVLHLIYTLFYAVLRSRMGDSMILTIINAIKDLFRRFGNFIVNAIFSLNSRNCEKQADYFAYKIGFGEELKDALFLLKQIDTSGDLTIMERIYATHPDLDVRIARLEQLEQME